MDDFEFLPVTADRWLDLAEFFEQNGNPNYCWCMRWRLKSTAFTVGGSVERKRQLQALVNENIPVGIMAYHEGKAIGWCSIAPRETYIALDRSRVLKRVDEQPVWSVACFFIDRGFRGQGLASKLLKAAVDYAKSEGAEIVEGYPVEPDKSYRFMGAPAVFDNTGFQEVAEASNGRKIVRIHVS